MKFSEFPIDRFLKMREEKAAFMRSFYDGTGARVAVTQKPGYAFTRAICRYRDKQLESELDFLANCMRYDTDLLNSCLEPWLGVGIYAAGFGAKYIWSDFDAPQTKPFIMSADEIPDIRLKSLSDWPEMQEVIERIRYFRQETGGMLGITPTDTQSPNDTASLMMDTTEFFTACLAEPEAIEPLLTRVTDAVIDYTRIQMEEAGDLAAGPGHIAVSGMGIPGLMLSDDNLAILSPAAYRASSEPYLQRISDAFGGVGIHSCGSYMHNVSDVLNLKGLYLLDCALDKGQDPNPNSPARMAELLKGHDNVILQCRIGLRNADQLKPLLDAGIRLHIIFGPDPDIDRSNALVYEFKQKYLA